MVQVLPVAGGGRGTQSPFNLKFKLAITMAVTIVALACP